jgi:hypothetical protein
VAIVRRIDKQLRFLQQLHGAVGIGRLTLVGEFLGFKEILGTFSTGIFVPEELRVIKATSRLLKNVLLEHFFYSENSGTW